MTKLKIKQRGKFEEIPFDDNEERVCKVCNLTKKLHYDFRYHSGADYYLTFCKECENERRRLKYAGLPIPEKFNVLKKNIKVRRVNGNKPWRKTSYYNRKRLDYKSIDKRKGFESDLTIEFIEKCFNSTCEYCGYPAITLDRIDNNVGHTIANCVPACYECNTARNRIFSYEEMKVLGKCIKEIKDSRENYKPSKSIFPVFKTKVHGDIS